MASIGGLVEAGDLADAVLLLVAVAVLGGRHLHADAANLLEAGVGAIGLAVAEVHEEVELDVRAIAHDCHGKAPPE
jgi:hypothetical protein